MFSVCRIPVFKHAFILETYHYANYGALCCKCIILRCIEIHCSIYKGKFLCSKCATMFHSGILHLSGRSSVFNNTAW